LLAFCSIGLGAWFLYGHAGLIYGSPVVVGLAAAPFFPRAGRGLLGLGLMFLTLMAVLFLAPQFIGAVVAFGEFHESQQGGLMALSAASIAWIVWADVEFVLDERARKRGRL
jgi:hypothetical protein